MGTAAGCPLSPWGCPQPRRAVQGGKEHLMRAHFGLPSVEKEEDEGRPPIAVRFEIPYFTVSGIQVTNGDGGGCGWWPQCPP